MLQSEYSNHEVLSVGNSFDGDATHEQTLNIVHDWLRLGNNLSSVFSTLILVSVDVIFTKAGKL
jgi:hypothetical protein